MLIDTIETDEKDRTRAQHLTLSAVLAERETTAV